MTDVPLKSQFYYMTSQLLKKPVAYAKITGSEKYPDINGYTWFFSSDYGTLAATEVFGLPADGKCKAPVFGFHIHSGSSCTGNDSDPFADAEGHLNPNNCPHPAHSGDMPPLFGSNGYAYSVFFTNRITTDEIIGKTVVIHNKPDDFKTQPSGDSGDKIACGKIQKY